ncbi:MAG: hypothetical protein KF799_09120 [Bdellovibrionales bacterium]|nr:hypothetical protein [Bdellovibrionales bacterium]
MRYWLGLGLIISVPVFAALPSGLSLNPKLKASESSVSDRGFAQTFEQDGIEIHLKGTQFSAPQAARQMAAVELANVMRLYSTRGNPYEGQISDLIKCSPLYTPQVFEFKLNGYVVPGISAGATDRKLFGACAREQIGYWAAYISFYYPPAQMVIEARLFKRAAHPSAQQLKTLNKSLQRAASSLLRGSRQ